MPDPRPNILLFLTDDHGEWAMGCSGTRELQTPNLDWMASHGVRMSRAFTPSPVCSPARACFFTGRLPSQHGVHDWIQERNSPEKDWLGGEITLPELLQQAGYHTGLVGKWHCGRSWEKARGFDSWFGFQRDQFPHSGEMTFVENGSPLTIRGNRTQWVTAKALEFLRQESTSRPFFLSVGYVDTHAPFAQHPERLVDRYRDCSFEDVPQETPAGRSRVWIKLAENPDARREELAQYFAAVTHIDEQVGILLDELESRGELENSLLIYTSDHGHMNGQHGLATKGNATIPQNFYEESIRVPQIFYGPAWIGQGQVCDTMSDHCDLFQTVLEATGTVLPPDLKQNRRYPGKSAWSNLTNPQAPGIKDTQFCEYGNARMIRTSRFKFIRRYPPHSGAFPDELYDLAVDPRERENLAENGVYATVIGDLALRIEDYFRRYEDPARSGVEILRQPVCNPFEPWRLAWAE